MPTVAELLIVLALGRTPERLFRRAVGLLLVALLLVALGVFMAVAGS